MDACFQIILTVAISELPEFDESFVNKCRDFAFALHFFSALPAYQLPTLATADTSTIQ